MSEREGGWDEGRRGRRDRTGGKERVSEERGKRGRKRGRRRRRKRERGEKREGEGNRG